MKKRRVSPDEVRGWCDWMSVRDRCNLTSPPPGEPRTMRQLAEARKFVAEKKLVAWVKQQNEERGLAPSPGLVLDHVPAELDFRGRRNERRRRVRRVMARWGGHKGIFAGGDRLPLGVLQEKAPVGRLHRRVFRICINKRSHFGDRQAGPRSGRCCFRKATVSKAGPPGGPLSGTVFITGRSPGVIRGVCWRLTGRPGLVGGGATFWRPGRGPANVCCVSIWTRRP